MKILMAFVSASLIGAAAAGPQRPNLVLIVADDCTYLDLEIHGGQARTPHLKRLADQGMTFTRCFQAAPMCSPTRHNLYTGLYPVKSGAWPNHTCVYPGTRSIAHYLKAGGYRVALSGKTHIAPKESFPFEYSSEFNTADPESENPYPKLRRLIRESRDEGNPFCLVACSNEPHSPYTRGDPSAYPPDSLRLPPSWVDTPETRALYSKYLAEITYFDAQCGALLELLGQEQARENTLVAVVSEQGSGFPFSKWTCYEMGLASTLIASWPDRIKRGSRSEALVEYVDFTPTLLEAAGLPVPEALDGRSFLAVLLGREKEHKRYTYGIHTTRGIIHGSDAYGIRSAATKRFRYIRNLNADATFTNVVTNPRGKGVGFWQSWLDEAGRGEAHAREMTRRYQHRPPEELYDVNADPHCLVNLIDDSAHADIRKELSDQLDQWMESQGDRGVATETAALTRQPRHRQTGAKGKRPPGPDPR